MSLSSSNFTKSVVLNIHPILKFNNKIRMRYYIALQYLFNACNVKDIYSSNLLERYYSTLVSPVNLPFLSSENQKKILYNLINNRVFICRKKIKFLLLCDICLILLNTTTINQVKVWFMEYVNKRNLQEIERFYNLIISNEKIPSKYLLFSDLLKQIRSNNNFITKKQKNFLVTSNVSAGKSTLINAIIGKPITRTSQEICTGNLCYLYTKPFEDHFVHLSSSQLNLNASYNDLAAIDSCVVSSIAVYFQIPFLGERVCIIDTPGVNSSIHCNHRTITKQAVKKEAYDKLVYVLNANKLGIDEEKEYVQWILKNVPLQKVVFVLNKLDEFRSIDDSIENSINGVKKDLYALGYENPIICPLSAYFAFLLKLKENEAQMTEDEIDAYNLYRKKFFKKEYDLSIYHDGAQIELTDSEFIQLSKKCGLYSLEKILFEGDNL